MPRRDVRPSDLLYLRVYPEPLLDQVCGLIADGRLGSVLLQKYPQAHSLRSDRALYEFTAALKSRHLRNAGLINKVQFDNKLHVIRHALGTHTSVSRVQGGKLAAKHEIRIASLFRVVPEAFLRMIVVHELAHMREREHDKAFYQLCLSMEPEYHQYEFDVRLYLTYLDGASQACPGATAVQPLWT